MLYEKGYIQPPTEEAKQFTSFNRVMDITNRKSMMRWLIFITLICLMVLLLPWTQNIKGRGQLTSLRPDQRPQTIPSIIGGRIEKLYIREGDFVKRGDTIMFLSETKDEYFDPNLLANVDDQIRNKESSVGSYMQKVNALDAQIDALNKNVELKLQQQQIKVQQLQLKVTTDSTERAAVNANAKVAQEQIARFKELFNKGLISETELETREVSAQNAMAKTIEADNKLMIARQELINAKTELNSLRAEYTDKISKAESEKYSAMSAMYDTEAQVTKLQNSYANYSMRNGMYYILAPQDGYITKAVKTGIGETIKEGEEIITIMPASYDLAVEMYVEPMDLPLLQKQQKVRFIFDGWPAFVFSGWPGASFGTYGGKIVAIDNFISENGKYRILVAQDPDDEPWPSGLRVGAGADGMGLLNDVPIWYELWRQFNGFPPDFYKKENAQQGEQMPNNNSKQTSK
ncbi:MAG: HlyD family secretion protein [Flavobacteriales bacterium]